MRHLTAFVFLSFLYLMLLGLPASCHGADDVSTASLLKQAVQFTRFKDYASAERCYVRMSDLDPTEGLPSLARFLFLTGQTTRTQPLLSAPQLNSQPPVVRARVAIEGGMPEAAIKILREATPPGYVYRQSVLLGNQLQVVKQPAEAAAALASGIGSAELTPMERLDLLKKIAYIGDGAALDVAIPTAAEALVSSCTLDYQVIRPIVWDAVLSRSNCPDFGSFHERLLHSQNSATISWLAALAAIRRGDAKAAYQTLKAAADRPMSARERAVILEELAMISSGDLKEALRIREEILPASSDPDRLHLEAAEISVRLKNYAAAMAHLRVVNPAKLEEEHQRLFYYVRLAAMAKLESAEAVVQAFWRDSVGMKWKALRDLAEAPFEHLDARQDMEAIRRAILTQLADPTTSPSLYALLLSTEHRLGSQEGMLAALAGYVRVKPGDTDAQQDLGDVSACLAASLGQPSTKDGASTASTKAVADEAAQALWKVVEAKPYIPEPYGKLMELYRFFGQPEKARKVPQYLSGSTTAPAESVHLAAYIYATNGMPEEALPLYKRALAMEPNNPRYRLNYAGALTRMGRFDEAEKIYYDLILNGTSHHQYHTHELYAGAYELASKRNAVDEFIAFLKQQLPNQRIPQRDVFLIDAGKLLRKRDHAADAIPFFEAAARLFPERAGDAAEELIEAHLTLKQSDKAEAILTAMEGQATSTAERLRVQYNRGILKASAGDTDNAVKIWQQIAAEHPKDKQAGRSLLAAAQTLLQVKRSTEARQVLEKYLLMDTGDVESEASARQMLEQIKKGNDPQPAGGLPQTGGS